MDRNDTAGCFGLQPLPIVGFFYYRKKRHPGRFVFRDVRQQQRG